MTLRPRAFDHYYGPSFAGAGRKISKKPSSLITGGKVKINHTSIVPSKNHLYPRRKKDYTFHQINLLPKRIF